MKQTTIFIWLTAVMLLVACTPAPGEESVSISVTRVVEETAVPEATATPFTDTATGWQTYQTDYFRINYPSEATLATEGDCLQIYYEAGYVTISTPPPGEPDPPCDPTQMEGYEILEISGRIRIEDIAYLTSGSELHEPETGNWAGEALGVQIDENATLVTYGTVLRQGHTQEKYEIAKVILMEIINTYERLETAVSVPVPGEETAAPAPSPAPTVAPANQLSVCQNGLETAELVSPSGPLRVAYSSGGIAGVWREEWNQVELYPLPPDATNALITADAEHVAFSRHPSDDTTEIWVMNGDGSAPRKLAAVSKSAYLQNQPDYVIDAHLSYHWIGSTHDLAYTWVPVLDALGDVPLDVVTVVTAETGDPRVIIPVGEVNTYIPSPNGSQIAALTNTELRLIQTADGSVEFTHSLPLFEGNDQSLSYSPDGRYLAVFTKSGITIIDINSYTAQDIALSYQRVGLGEYAFMPPISWLDNTRFYALFPDPQKDAFDPEARFLVGLVNVAEGWVEPVNSFAGNVLDARFSPDLRYLVFWSQQANNRTLYLADVTTGEQVTYASGSLIEILGWNPDSTHFVYWFAETREPLLGHLCSTAAPLLSGYTTQRPRWIDANRFLLLAGEAAESGMSDNGRWEIHLHTLDGQDTLVTIVEGPYPAFSFSFAQ